MARMTSIAWVSHHCALQTNADTDTQILDLVPLHLTLQSLLVQLGQSSHSLLFLSNEMSLPVPPNLSFPLFLNIRHDSCPN